MKLCVTRLLDALEDNQPGSFVGGIARWDENLAFPQRLFHFGDFLSLADQNYFDAGITQILYVDRAFLANSDFFAGPGCEGKIGMANLKIVFPFQGFDLLLS